MLTIRRIAKFTDRSEVHSWAIFLTILVTGAYFLVVPVFKPRGIYFGWRYRLPDLYLGVPLLTAAICMLIVLCTPRSLRRPRALRLTTAYLASCFTVFGLDASYALVGTTVLGFPHYDVWLYSSGISSKSNLRDDELGFVRKSGLHWTGESITGLPATTYRTDENGFRNPPGIRQADVAIIGDSFVEAGAVEETETAVQQIFRTTGLRTVNLGRTHYGPPEYLIVTRRYALEYRPRAIVWAIFEGNDLSDTESFVRWRNDPGSRQTLLQRFASRSLIAQLLPRAPISLRARRDFHETGGTLGAVDVDYPYYPDAPVRWRRGWEETVKAIHDAHVVCELNGIRFLVLSVPIKVRVLGNFVEFKDSADRDTWLPGGVTDSPKDFASTLSEECRRIGCDFIDLTAPLRRAAEIDNRRIYFTIIDTHLNVDGNRVFADEVSGWLRSQNLVTSDLSP